MPYNSTTVIFVETSLSRKIAAQCAPEAVIKPSAKCGDVLHACQEGVKRIVLIDGYFGWTPAVWHKEILYALEQGVQVIGAASMGALRAVELHDYGMLGCGQVFEYYRTCPIADDADVAVFFPKEAPHDTTVPLINLRLSLAQSQVLETEHIIDTLNTLHYTERTWQNIEAILSAEHYAIVKQHYRDVKYDDAYRCLATLSSMPKETSVSAHCPRSFFFKRLVDEMQTTDEPTAIYKRMQTITPLLSIESTFDGRVSQLKQFYQTSNAVYINAWLSSVVHLNISLSEIAFKKSLDIFRVRSGLLKGIDFKQWCIGRNLSLEKLEQTLHDYFLIKRLVLGGR